MQTFYRSAPFLAVLTISISMWGEESITGIADVQADRLEVLHRERQARFAGHVKVRFKELSMHCDRMEVSYSDTGEILDLSATGGIVVRLGEAEAEAKSARLDTRTGLLMLEGDPVLSQGPHRLRGRQIVVDLSTKRLDVLEAKAVFQLGNAGVK